MIEKAKKLLVLALIFNITSMGSFGWATEEAEHIEYQALGQNSDGRYRIYQGDIHLSSWVFKTMEGAIAEAKKWNNSRVEQNGHIVWKFGEYGIERESYKLYQGDIHIASWVFKTKEGAIAEAKKWNNSHVEYGGNIVWTFSGGNITRSKFKPKYIAHGGGEINGLYLTNSKEAILNSLDRGINYVELDFSLTSDNRYVLLHDWERVNSWMDWKLKSRTHAEFMEYPMKHKLTMLDLEGLIDIMVENPELRVITDIKGGNKDLLKKIAWSYPGLKSRIIPQVYHEDEYFLARSLGFKDIIYSLYQVWRSDAQVLDFAKENQLFAVTMGTQRTETSLPRQLKELGLMTYCHTVNSRSEVVRYMNRGIQGVYTDTLN